MQLDLDSINMKFDGKAYAKAKPFPHVIIDNFLPADVVAQIEKDFPGPDNDFWFRHVDIRNRIPNAEKLASNDLGKMPDSIKKVLEFLTSEPFLEKLSKCTGIPGLMRDDDYHGGGMHLIRKGGFLNVHADFNLHPTTKLHRRLNLLLYLNPEWKPEYKGQLELWDTKMQGCVQSVDPVLNRCVIFSTTSNSFHGHPEKLDCPPDRVRKSLALYYYSPTRPWRELRDPHTTLYSPIAEPSLIKLATSRVMISRPVRFAGKVARLPRRVAGKIKRRIFS